jgi:predicted Rossmann fold nucleotide-binding protein DprA/Smf involved in DNA uptake
MNAIMIKKTESGFEVSNGTIHVRGPSRDQLLAIFDSLEGKPASVAQIAEKVEKAAKVVQKKAAAKKVSNTQKIRDYMAQTKGTKSIAEIADGTKLTSKQVSDRIWKLWKNGEVKSIETGLYSK